MLIRRFLPTHVPKARLLQFQNMYAMYVLTRVMKGLFDFYFNGDYESVVASFNILCYYVSFDMLFCEKIIYFHHFLCGVLGYLYFTNLEAMNASKDFCALILTTEVSTFFLTLRAILEDVKHLNIYTKTAHNTVSALFSITFFYFRFYVYINAMYSDQYASLLSAVNYFDRGLLKIGLNGLLLLNIYWGRLILKSVYRMVYPKTRDERMIV